MATNAKATGGRDPDLLFVGIPTVDGYLVDPLQRFWDSIPDGGRLGRWTILKRKVVSYDTATARNILTSLALSSIAGRMLLIDSDVNVGAAHVERIAGHAHRFVAGVYPRKEISLTQRWVLNAHPSGEREGDLIRCLDVGGGFVCVDLVALEEVVSLSPSLEFLSEYDWNRGESMVALWDPLVVEEDWGLTGRWRRRLTDDFAFCFRLASFGWRIWADSHCTCGHVGPVDFLAVTTALEQLKSEAGLCPPPAAGALAGRAEFRALRF